MNSVFFQLKGEFDVQEDYSGKEVIATILNVVRVSVRFLSSTMHVVVVVWRFFISREKMKLKSFSNIVMALYYEKK